MEKHNLLLIWAAIGLLTLFAGCIGEGEQEFRPTPGIINVNY